MTDKLEFKRGNPAEQKLVDWTDFSHSLEREANHERVQT